MGQYIKGQEVEVIAVLDGVPQTDVFLIRSFEFTFQQSISSEGYLGETTNRKDSIFNGISGMFDAHIENAKALSLYLALVDKARRRTPGTILNVKATLNFPNGDRPRVLIPNVECGDLPVKFGSRSDYGSVSIPFEASTASVIS